MDPSLAGQSYSIRPVPLLVWSIAQNLFLSSCSPNQELVRWRNCCKYERMHRKDEFLLCNSAFVASRYLCFDLCRHLYFARTPLGELGLLHMRYLYMRMVACSSLNSSNSSLLMPKMPPSCLSDLCKTSKKSAKMP